MGVPFKSRVKRGESLVPSFRLGARGLFTSLNLPSHRPDVSFAIIDWNRGGELII